MAVTVEQLGPQHEAALRALLMRDPGQHLYLLGLLEDFGAAAREGRGAFAFYGRTEGGVVTDAVFVGGAGALVVPTATSPLGLAELARGLGAVRLRACVGERVAVEALLRHWAPGRPRTSKAQRLFAATADDLGPFTNPTLRQATEADLPQLLPLAAGAVHEALGRDPLAEDPQGFPARVLQRVRAGRTWVLEEAGALVFKCDVGARSRHGAELEGVYTRPDVRGRGHATLSLGQLSRKLLAGLPRLALRIDDGDPALTAVARKVGYHAGRAQRFVLAD